MICIAYIWVRDTVEIAYPSRTCDNTKLRMPAISNRNDPTKGTENKSFAAARTTITWTAPKTIYGITLPNMISIGLAGIANRFSIVPRSDPVLRGRGIVQTAWHFHHLAKDKLFHLFEMPIKHQLGNVRGKLITCPNAVGHLSTIDCSRFIRKGPSDSRPLQVFRVFL